MAESAPKLPSSHGTLRDRACGSSVAAHCISIGYLNWPSYLFETQNHAVPPGKVVRGSRRNSTAKLFFLFVSFQKKWAGPPWTDIFPKCPKIMPFGRQRSGIGLKQKGAART